ncbi:hypothetical protein ACJJTC_007449 [Scirpophaga incertulas]
MYIIIPFLVISVVFTVVPRVSSESELRWRWRLDICGRHRIADEYTRAGDVARFIRALLATPTDDHSNTDTKNVGESVSRRFADTNPDAESVSDDIPRRLADKNTNALSEAD